MNTARGNTRFGVILLAVVLLLAPLKAFAAHGGNCSISSTPLTFMPYDFLDSVATNGTGTISISCAPPETSVNVAIGPSSNSGGFSPRRMKNSLSADTLDYNIYTNLVSPQVWGDNTNGTTTVNISNTVIKKNNFPDIIVYGRIAPLQNVSVGNYSEQLTMTINY